MNTEAIGARIRSLRKNLNLTQDTVSEKLNITPGYYSHIENGSRNAGLGTFVKIADYYNVSLDYILAGQKQKSNDLDTLEKKILHNIKFLSEKEKIFVLEFIESLNKFTK